MIHKKGNHLVWLPFCLLKEWENQDFFTSLRLLWDLLWY